MKEIITSGYKGWKRRIERRKEESGTGSVYRSAAKSLPSRARKKLTGKVDWYRKKEKGKRDREDQEPPAESKRRRVKPEKEEERIVSVMFVPYTAGSELVKRLRNAENELAKQTGIKIKMVEKAGVKLVDQLHKSDPWEGGDCERENCLLCKTKVTHEEVRRQDCTRRNIVYETWCLSCEKRDKEKIEAEEEDEKIREEKIRRMPLYKYVGETARSAFERGIEHHNDYEGLKIDSHMLKHYLEKHEDEDFEKIKFGMKIIKTARTAFERQISESVEIQNKKKNNYILNSKSEYNCCALPRLTAKIGNYTLDELEKRK